MWIEDSWTPPKSLFNGPASQTYKTRRNTSSRCLHALQSVYWQFTLCSGSITTKPRCLAVYGLWITPANCIWGSVCSVMRGAVRLLVLMEWGQSQRKYCLDRDANGTSSKCKLAAIPCDVTSFAFVFSRETFFNTPTEKHSETKTSESRSAHWNAGGT